MVEHYLDRLARTINENWDRPALTDFYLTEDGSAQDTSRGNHYTYGEMYAEILRLGELFAALGLQKGDHIAICGANSAHWAIAYLAIAAYQGVVVTVLHSQATEDIAHQIDFSDAKALFTDEDLWEELKSQSLPQVKHVISLADWSILQGNEITIPNRKSIIANQVAHFSHGNPDELAMICFTSGSTGHPKGVMLAAKSINEHIRVAYKLYPIEYKNNYISLLPFSHTAGLIGDVLTHIVNGLSIYINREKLDIDKIFIILRLVKPYMLISVPLVFQALYNKYKKDYIDAIRLNCRLIIMGMAKWGESLDEILSTISIPVCTGYSQTEAGASICLTPYKEWRRGSSGKVVDGYTVKITSNGEILVKGENVMLGYYKDPEATAQKIDKDGWLHTGDKGHLDEDGYLYVEGRLEQDMIVLPNGENIRPDNIEALINAIPEVKESIVLAREGKLVAIVVPQISNLQSSISNADLRRKILRQINPQLPLFSQLYDVEITDTPLQRTEKQTIKRYLYS